MIIGRKSQIERLGCASRKAQGIGFELGQHLLLAQDEDEIAGLAAGEFDPVDRAHEIRGHAIARCGRPLHAVEMLALLAQDLQCLVDFGLAHRERSALDPARTDVAQHHFRVDLERGAELDALGIGLARFWLDARIAGHLELLLAHRVAECFLNGIADNLRAHLRPVLLGDEFHRHLARTKTRHAQVARQLLQPLVDLLLDFINRNRHVQAALERA